MRSLLQASKAGGRGTGGPLSRRVKEGNLRTSRRETSHLFSGAALTLSPPNVTCCDIMWSTCGCVPKVQRLRPSFQNRPMPEASTGSRLEVSVFGQIVGARLPSGAMSHAAAALGLGSSAAHCTYRLSAGDGWACERGAAAGSSHTDWPASAGTFVWEQPVDATFVGPHLGGWPRVEVEVRWVDVHGRSEVAGYAAQHLPKTPGTHALSCRVWRPRGSLLERLSAFFVGASPQAPCIHCSVLCESH